MPIDPNGCTVDLARTCFRRKIRPWRNDPTEVEIRFYRGRPGAPSLDFVHSFAPIDLWDDQPPLDLPPGAVGIVPEIAPYDKGRRPTVYAPNGSFVGSEEQWLEGSIRGVDSVLHPTRAGSSLECLAQLGITLRMHRWGQMIDGQQAAC